VCILQILKVSYLLVDGVATAAMAAAAVTAAGVPRGVATPVPPTAVMVPSAVTAAAAPGGAAVVTEAVADPLTCKRVICCFIVSDLRLKYYKNRSREIL
jgi:hypothetical protein